MSIATITSEEVTGTGMTRFKAVCQHSGRTVAWNTVTGIDITNALLRWLNTVCPCKRKHTVEVKAVA